MNSLMEEHVLHVLLTSSVISTS